MVTLVVAMLNESESIAACLSSIAAQAYPSDRLEVLVYEGGSDDRSVEIAQRFLPGRPTWALRPNQGRIQAAAWNLGIDAARGEVIGIVSGHAELDPGYVAAAVAALDRTGADMVGGPVNAIGTGAFGEAAALATSSPFGVGDARHHYTQVETDVDSVFMGLCRAETYRRFRFDEAMVRNQDDELSYRLRKVGGRIVCDPAIQSRYRNRSSAAGLWRQYFAYGFWKVEVARRHPGQIQIRQLVPAAFVTSLSVTAILSPFSALGRVGLTAVLGSYLVADAAASVSRGRGTECAVATRLPFVFPILHMAYGSGFTVGLVRRVLGR
jgi:succinoglycan biosynthesis protein ExoA